MCVSIHRELADIVGHSGSGVLLYDSSLAERALELAKLSGDTLQLVESPGVGDAGYESLLDSATELAGVVDDERSLLSINYTSGTTGRPKGVMYHHRGAYLQALAMAFHTGLGPESKFLWTLPMFHCNGWCFPWAVTAAAGTHVCLRVLDPALAWGHIERDGITHLCAAPTVLTMLSDHPAAKRAPNRLTIATGGSAPSPTLLGRMSDLNADLIHLYGLTETFGPTVLCEWKPEWDGLPAEDQHRRKAMQGVGNVISERLRVVDPAGRDVPTDGATLGEVALRGNNVMTGYFGGTGTRRRRRFPTGGFAPATSGCFTRTVTSSSTTERRTSSSQAGRTSPRSRWNRPSPPTRRSRRSRSSGFRTTSGESGRRRT